MAIFKEIQDSRVIEFSDDSMPRDELPFGGHRTVIGKGTHSVALRVGPTEKGVHFVAVIKPDEHKARESHALGYLVRRCLPDFTQEENLVIAADKNKRRIAVKVSKEVQGGTLFDYGIVNTIFNRRLRQQMMCFSHHALRVFKEQGMFVDLWGRKDNSIVDRLIIASTPLHTNNIAIDDNSLTVTLVDSEIQKTDFISTKSVWHQTRLKYQEAILKGWLLLMHGVDVADYLYKFTKPTEEVTEYDAGFTTGLKKIIEKLDNSGIPYFVVGSVAQAAWEEFYNNPKTLSLHRADGSKRDVDIIVGHVTADELEALQHNLQSISDNPIYPAVSLHQAIPLDEYQRLELKKKRIGTNTKILYSVPVINDDTLEFAYDNLRIAVSQDDLEPATVLYQGIPIRTFQPRILAGLALTRGGATKFKDVDKIISLLRSSGQRIPPEFSDFARGMRIRYPQEYTRFLLVELLAPIKKRLLSVFSK